MSEPTDKVRLTAFVSSQNNQICHWYNPYFGNGCPNGTDCKFRHLKEKDFIAFCTRISKTDRPSNAIRNTFRSAIDLLVCTVFHLFSINFRNEWTRTKLNKK